MSGGPRPSSSGLRGPTCCRTGPSPGRRRCTRPAPGRSRSWETCKHSQRPATPFVVSMHSWNVAGLIRFEGEGRRRAAGVADRHDRHDRRRGVRPRHRPAPWDRERDSPDCVRRAGVEDVVAVIQCGVRLCARGGRGGRGGRAVRPVLCQFTVLGELALEQECRADVIRRREREGGRRAGVADRCDQDNRGSPGRLPRPAAAHRGTPGRRRRRRSARAHHKICRGIFLQNVQVPYLLSSLPKQQLSCRPSQQALSGCRRILHCMYGMIL